MNLEVVVKMPVWIRLADAWARALAHRVTLVAGWARPGGACARQ